MNTCKCGCGSTIATNKTWVSGHNSRRRFKTPVEKACEQCGEPFTGAPAYMRNRTLCGLDCRNRKNAERLGALCSKVAAACPICSAEFFATPLQIENGRTCSMDCGRKARSRKISGARRRRSRNGKMAARLRDNFRCCICAFDFATAVHHIVPKAKGGGNDIGNLITLCPNHHYMAHADLYTAEYLRSLLVAYNPEMDLRNDPRPNRHEHTVLFRGR